MSEIDNSEEIYKKLYLDFEPINKILPEDSQTELDGLLYGVAKTWDQDLTLIHKTYQTMLLNLRDECAAAVCPMCNEGIPREEFNGREIHVSLDKISPHSFEDPPTPVRTRCAANGMFSIGFISKKRRYIYVPLPKTEKENIVNENTDCM